MFKEQPTQNKKPENATGKLFLKTVTLFWEWERMFFAA